MESELDELRRLLDSKTPLRSGARPGGGRSYIETIDATSASVDRLGQAIARAEADVDASLPRRDGVAMAVSAQRDSEVKELRRILASKESAIDSLRETLSGANLHWCFLFYFFVSGRMKKLKRLINISRKK